MEKHTLNDYIALLEERSLLAAPVPDSLDRSAAVELVSYDSREVVPGTLFLCKGAHFKAEFLQMAQEKGAIAYVSEKPYPESPLPCLLVSGMRSYDHISPIEHSDFEDYFSSKLRIFRQGAVNCVNLDCGHADRIFAAALEAGRPVYTFSQRDKEADVFASQVRKRGGDILFQVRTRRYEREFRLTMPGLFNVENALAAITVCEALGVPQRHIYAGLERARVPGRMEVYSNAGETVTAIVDYAHNRMSFETLFRSVQAEYPGRRIVTVFGCPGLKALDRRRDLGEISGKYSDLVVLTEEDSGEEDTLSICQEIAGHVAEQGCAYIIQPNRGEAIRQAILSCKEPSILLITGKGQETRQKRGREYVEVPTDVDYVHAFLREYDAARQLDGLEKVRSLLALLPALEKHRGRKAAVWSASPGEDLRQDASALRTVGMEVSLVQPGGDFPADADYVVYLAPMGEGSRLGGRMDTRRVEELLSAGAVPQELTPMLEHCLTARRRPPSWTAPPSTPCCCICWTSIRRG